MTKAPSLLLAALLALGALAAVPGAQAVTGATGSAEFVDLAHHTLSGSTLVTDHNGNGIPDLIGIGVIGVVHLVDADLEQFNTATVTVKSGSDSTGESITLYNDPSGTTGDFYGTFGVEGTANANNGLVQVANGGQFFIDYSDAITANGQPAPFHSPNNLLEWRSSADGAITLPGDLFGASSVSVGVTDPDASAVTGHAYSSSDLTGIDLSFTKQGNDFKATLPLGPTHTGSQVQVLDGDQIVAYFTDVDAHGRQVQRQATSIWHQTNSGAIAFTTKDFTATVTRVGGVGDKVANLRVEDADLIGSSTLTVRVTSAIDAIGMDVALTSTGTGTGEFTGTFGFTETSTGGGKLHVAPGNTVTARYTDAKAADGTSTTRTATAVWNPAPTLRFTDDTFTNDVTTSSTSTSPHLQLTAPGADTTAGQDFARVKVTSNRDPLGLYVTLKETAAHSGVFQDAVSGHAFGYATQAGGTGSEAETSQGAGDGVLVVRNAANGGDTLTVTFLEDPSGVIPTDTMKVTSGTGEADQTKGTLLFHTCTANCGTTNPTLGPAPSGGFVGIATNLVFVELVDAKLNHTTNPETVHVRIGSTTDPISWNTGGTDLTGGLDLTLTETGAATGHFVGKFGTTTGSSSGNLLHVQDTTDTIGVAYAYVTQWDNQNDQPKALSDPQTCPDGSTAQAVVPPTNPPTTKCTLHDRAGKGTLSTIIAHATPDNAVLDFHTQLRGGVHATQFTGLGAGYISLSGIDAKEDTTGSANTVKVHVRSTSDSTGIDVTLTERYGHAAADDLHLADDDAFLGQIVFTSESSSASGGKLKVANGDVLEASYTDPVTRSGATSVTIYAPSDTKWKSGATGTFTLPVSVHQDESPTPAIQVNDADQNTRSSLKDTVEVQVIPAFGREPVFKLILTETDVNTGVFKADLKVQTSCSLDDAVCVVSGDRVTVRYLDPSAATGSPATVESTFVGLASHGGLLVLDHAAYATLGATALVFLDDADLNIGGSKDTVDVRILSDSDGEGEKVTLTETDALSHNFTGTFGFESSRTEGNGKVHVENGDRVTVYYLDVETNGANGADNVPVLTSATWTSSATSPPHATLTAAPSSGAAPLDVTFTLAASDSDGAIASYTLAFGDTSTALSGTGVPPTSTTHTYAADGSYTARLTVTDNGGLLGYSNATVTVGNVQAPTLSSVSPGSGLPAGGTAVTLTGTNFGSGATVTFGGVAATDVTVVSATSITAKTPAHALGTVDVVVTVGSLTATKAGGFTYTDNPSTTTTTDTHSTTSSSTSTTNNPTGAPTPGQILSANQKVHVTVTHASGKNTVKFTLPATGLPGTVLGVQVWRSNSPYALVATLPNSDPDFKDGSYDDVSSEAKDTTKYLVTMYYGATSAFGLFTQSTAPDTAQYPGASAAGSSGGGGGGGGLPSWAIVLIVVGILFLVVLVAILIARGRNRDTQAAATQGYAWQETTEAKAAEDEWQPPAEVHQARCPSCGTSFTAAGTKPIVTVCPGCGKKGILR
jgi:hypothetical protein